jgi:hypothetical protein
LDQSERKCATAENDNIGALLVIWAGNGGIPTGLGVPLAPITLVCESMAHKNLCNPESRDTMKTISGRFAISAGCAAVILLVVGACSTHPIPTARLSKSAFITAGDTNVWLAATGKSVSVVDVDGAVPEYPQGPVELAPGPHKIKLKCNDNISEQDLTVAAGEIYQFSVYVVADDHHTEGRLQRIKPAS